MNTLSQYLTKGISSLATMILSAFATTKSALSAQPAGCLNERHAAAARLFRAGQYAGAFGRFAELADAGHVSSARLALAMCAHRGDLFGSRWPATPDQRRRWSALVISASRQRIELSDTGDQGN
jgi:hypothetical protein